jgi:hypothetical protein
MVFYSLKFIELLGVLVHAFFHEKKNYKRQSCLWNIIFPITLKNLKEKKIIFHQKKKEEEKLQRLIAAQLH